MRYRRNQMTCHALNTKSVPPADNNIRPAGRARAPAPITTMNKCGEELFRAAATQAAERERCNATFEKAITTVGVGHQTKRCSA